MGESKKIEESKNMCNYADIPLKDIESNKVSAEKYYSSDENHKNEIYESIEADVSLSESELKIYSEEFECEWKFERKQSGLLPDEAINFLKKLTIKNDSCILTITDNGNRRSNWISECGNYWIDEKSF